MQPLATKGINNLNKESDARHVPEDGSNVGELEQATIVREVQRCLQIG